MPEEKVIYEQDAIKITTARAVFGEKTYAVSTISSVELVTVNPSAGLSNVLLGGGILASIFGAFSLIPRDGRFHPNWTMLVIGILCIAAGYAWVRSLKPKYMLRFTSTAGAVEAYHSEDRNKIQPIVDAINEAIIQKG